MIAPLRRRHRWLITVLALAVPAIYLAALASRPEPPIVETLPAALTPPSGEPAWEADLFTEPEIAVRAMRDATGWRLELAPRAPVAAPEVLVYWSPSVPAGDRLPERAWLLGALAGTRVRVFALPAATLGRPGTLVLYSLGHQRVVASAPLRAIGEGAAP